MEKKLQRSAFRDVRERIDALPPLRRAAIKAGARDILAAMYPGDTRELQALSQDDLPQKSGLGQGEV